MEPGNDGCGVGQRADKIHGDIRIGAHRCTSHHLLDSGRRKPIQQLGRVAHGRRQAQPLHFLGNVLLQPVQHSAQVPATVISGKRMQFIGNHHAQVAKPGLAVNACGHQHAFKRLGRGQQYVGRILQGVAFFRGRNIAVPDRHPPADQPGVMRQPLLQVVQQRLDRAHIDHTHPRPGVGQHAREHRNDGRFRLAASRGCQQQAMHAGKNRLNRLQLRGPQAAPAQ